jgi:hypothetical protein
VGSCSNGNPSIQNQPIETSYHKLRGLPYPANIGGAGAGALARRLLSSSFLLHVGWKFDFEPSGKVFWRNTTTAMKPSVIAKHPSIPYSRTSHGLDAGFPPPIKFLVRS